MIIRGIDGDNDWLYGKGSTDYRSGRQAIAENIQTRLQSFLGDCFFNLGAGVDWFNLLGTKNELALTLAVSSMIRSTQDVVGIAFLSVELNSDRALMLRYLVNTIIGQVENILVFNPSDLLTTEDGDILITEGGDSISI